MKPNLVCLTLAFWLMVGFLQGSFAAEEKREDPFRMKTISGQITAKTRYNFSLEFQKKGTESFEVIMPFNEKTKLIGYKGLAEIRGGDMVRVEAKEFYRLGTDGKEVVTGTMADVIALTKTSTGSGKMISLGGER